MWPVTHFRSADYLKFLRGLRKVSTKTCDQLHVFSLWRLTWVFDGTWKNFHKKVCPVTRFFAVETILSFWMGLRKLSTKRCGQLHLFRSADYLKFLRGLRKVSTKRCDQLHVFSLWRLSWVFDGTWKVSTKRCDQLHLFRSADYLKFLDGT